MAEVYNRCEFVYIWLGCPLPDGTGAVTIDPFSVIHHFDKNRHFHQLPGYTYNAETKKWSCNPQDPDFIALWESFRVVADSPWWTRAWTVQEAILPPRAIVMYGTYTTTFDALAAEQRAKVRHWKECFGDTWLSTPPSIAALLNGTNFSISSLVRTKQRTIKYDSLFDCVRTFLERKCVDPRDKIYSHLGVLSPSEARQMKPDYTKSTAQVYLEAATVIFNEQNWDPKCLLGSFGYNCPDLDVPSWVRNWADARAMKMQLRRVFLSYPLYNACAGRDGRMHFINEGKGKLGVTATRIDVVKECGALRDPTVSSVQVFENCAQALPLQRPRG